MAPRYLPRSIWPSLRDAGSNAAGRAAIGCAAPVLPSRNGLPIDDRIRCFASSSLQLASERKPPKPLSARFARRTGTSVTSIEATEEMTLDHFLLRDKGVKLWRDFLRASRNIANPDARRETLDWLRDEHFEGPSGLRQTWELQRIRDRLVEGNVALKRVCGPMELAAALNPQHGSFPKLRGRRRTSTT